MSRVWAPSKVTCSFEFAVIILVIMANDANVQHVTITLLPSEVIQHILEDRNLNITDVLRFAQSCKVLYTTVRANNQLWKTKFFQRWPSTLEDFEEQRECGNIPRPCWRKETKHRIVYRRSLMRKISRMSTTHGIKPDLPSSAMKEYDALFLPERGASPLNYHYFTDLVTFLGQCPSSFTFPNGEEIFKTIIKEILQKHYARLVNKYMRNTYFARKWQKFLALPKEQQIMEQGAMFVTKWSQSTKRVSACKVSRMLDDIAQQTRTLVTEKYPSVPINSIDLADLAKWKTENLYNDKWNNKDSRLILTALCEVMFERLGFHAVRSDESPMRSLLVDHVLKDKYGNPLILAIIFESVARRLGIHCEIVSYEGRYLLRWTEKNFNANEDPKRHYIDVSTTDRFDKAKQFLTSNSIDESAIEYESSVTKVTQQMFAYLKVAVEGVNAHRPVLRLEIHRTMLQSALAVVFMNKPRGACPIDYLASFYTRHDMSAAELVKALNTMLNLRDNNQTEELFTETESRKILLNVVKDLNTEEPNAEDATPKPEVKKRRRLRSSIPCRCCKRLRDFVECRRRLRMKAKKQRLRARRIQHAKRVARVAPS